jgi:hypothetical protein
MTSWIETGRADSSTKERLKQPPRWHKGSEAKSCVWQALSLTEQGHLGSTWAVAGETAPGMISPSPLVIFTLMSI